jgi:hypothetical protein
MLSYMRSEKPDVLAKIRDTKALDDDTAAALKARSATSASSSRKVHPRRKADGQPQGGMASLKALKIRIGSVKSTQKITKAMKMVAAAKLRRAQSNAEAGPSLCAAPVATWSPASPAGSPSARRAPADRRHRQATSAT